MDDGEIGPILDDWGDNGIAEVPVTCAELYELQIRALEGLLAIKDIAARLLK